MATKFSIGKLLNNNPDKFFKLFLGLMTVFMLLIYGQSISYDYTVDDAIVITENMYVQDGIKGIPGLWIHDTFQGFFKTEGKSNLVAGGRYRPWTPTLFALEQAIFGQNPAIGHLMNVLTAIGTTILIMVVLRRLMREKFGDKAAVYIASLTGLLFAVHPLHTEVIANIKGADEIWVLLASFLAIFFAMSDKISGFLRFILVLLFSFIAMMSKENALFLLAILPIFYKWSGMINWSDLIQRTFPMFIAVGIALVLRFIVLGFPTGSTSMELMNNPFLKWDGSQYVAFTASEKAGTVLAGLLTYLKLYIFPHPLTHDYYPEQIARIGLFHWKAFLSLALYGFLLTVMIINFRRRQFISLSLALFFLTLLPVSNIFFPIGTLASERFMFVPSLGLSLLIAYGVCHIKGRPFKLFNYFYAAVIIIFTILSFLRTQAWKDNYTLFLTDVKTSSASAKVNNAAAGELIVKAGNTENEEEQYRLAEESFIYADKAISIHPTYKNAYLLRGNSYLYRKMYDKAVQDYNFALFLDPGFSDAQNNKFLALRYGGRHYGEVEQNLKKSEEYLQQALQLRPNDYESLRLMGINQGIQNNNRAAIRYFKKALNVNKGETPADIVKNLGIAYAGLGMQDSSQYYLQIASQLEGQK